MGDASEFVSWPAWARVQRGLGASARGVLVELAALVDTRGAAIVEIGWLADVLGRHPRTIRRALATLEEHLLIVREARWEEGHQAPSRVQLVRGVNVGQALARASLEVRCQGEGLPSVQGLKPIGREDNDGLRYAFRAAEREGWRGVASMRIALSAVESGPSQFWHAVARRRAFDGVYGADAVADVLTTSWLVARESSASIIAAGRPWAAWTQAVVRQCAAESVASKADRDAVTALGVVPDACPIVAVDRELCDAGLDELEGKLGCVVAALRSAGMCQTLAWAGTARIVQIAVTETVSQRHTRAGRDGMLAALGVSPEAARAWMTLLVGSRRGVTPSAIEGTEEDLADAARLVVDAYSTHRLVA